MEDGSVWSRLDPEQTLQLILSRKVRLDGRKHEQCRKTSVIRGTIQRHTCGSALAKIGGTTVVAGVTLQVGKPAQETPTFGELGVEVHLPALANSRYSSIQAQIDEARPLESFLQSMIQSNHVIERSDLCIVEGKYVWKLNIDLVLLSNEGSVIDATLLAAVAALSDVRLPETSLTKDEELVLVRGPGRPLGIKRIPVALTLGVLNDTEGTLLADLDASEEEHLRTRVTVVADATGVVGAIRKVGGCALSLEQLQRCIELCRQRAVTVQGVLT